MLLLSSVPKAKRILITALGNKIILTANSSKVLTAYEIYVYVPYLKLAK